MTSGIYIMVFPNGRYYIGSSKNCTKRWYHHKHLLERGWHYNSLLQRTWRKHGEAQFLMLERVEHSKLLIREQVYLDAAPEGALLNLSKIAGYPEGTVEVLKGRSERAKMQHATGNLGAHTLTEKGKKRRAAAVSRALKGRKQKPEAVTKMRKACRERWTPELREGQRQRANAQYGARRRRIFGIEERTN